MSTVTIQPQTELQKRRSKPPEDLGHYHSFEPNELVTLEQWSVPLLGKLALEDSGHAFYVWHAPWPDDTPEIPVIAVDRCLFNKGNVTDNRPWFYGVADDRTSHEAAGLDYLLDIAFYRESNVPAAIKHLGTLLYTAADA